MRLLDGKEEVRLLLQPLAAVQVVVPFFYVGWVACLAQLVAGCVVLPTSARQAFRTTAADLIQACSTCMSFVGSISPSSALVTG